MLHLPSLIVSFTRMTHPLPPVGAGCQVTWTDGRAYPATVTALSPGWVQVRWDAGGALQWVPLHVVAPRSAALQFAATPVAAAPVAAVPAMAQWNAQPAPAPPSTSPSSAAAPPAPLPPKPGPQERAQALPSLEAVPHGPPPRPTSATIRDLPRGLVYEPTGSGAGTGKAFFVLFGFVSTADVDAAMRMTDIDHLGDDVAALRAAGYRVIVDLHGDLTTLDAALLGKYPDAGGAVTAGVFWGGHGDDDGTIATHDGRWIAPEQISPEVAKRGDVKLFVMSACYAGGHTARWQKALGAGTQIIGWGAPITNQRAIEFLVPDDANAKGFDDLLEKHLGARRVAADGPLAEVRDLATKHEERVATLLLTLDDLVEEARQRLKCRVDKGKKPGVYFLEIRTPPSKDAPNIPRSHVVRVATLGAGDAWIGISALVGPYSDALDLARGLRAIAGATQLRFTLTTIPDPPTEFMMVETLVRRRRLDAYGFANHVGIVGSNADRLEDMFFGSDRR
jgi:hypothetical protein